MNLAFTLHMLCEIGTREVDCRFWTVVCPRRSPGGLKSRSHCSPVRGGISARLRGKETSVTRPGPAGWCPDLGLFFCPSLTQVSTPCALSDARHSPRLSHELPPFSPSTCFVRCSDLCLVSLSNLHRIPQVV